MTEIRKNWSLVKILMKVQKGCESTWNLGEGQRGADPCFGSQMADRMTTASPFCFISLHQGLITGKGKTVTCRRPNMRTLHLLRGLEKDTGIIESRRARHLEMWKH